MSLANVDGIRIFDVDEGPKWSWKHDIQIHKHCTNFVTHFPFEMNMSKAHWSIMVLIYIEWTGFKNISLLTTVRPIKWKNLSMSLESVSFFHIDEDIHEDNYI